MSERGSVSIGSIYLRFESKENLVRGIIADALETLAAEEDAMFTRLRNSCSGLARFVPALIDEYTAFLSNHAPILRLALERAGRDELVSNPGNQLDLRTERT